MLQMLSQKVAAYVGSRQQSSSLEFRTELL